MIENDKVLVVFECENEDCCDNGAKYKSSVEDLLSVGTPICTECEEEMVPTGMSEIDTD